jgi:bifunctional oligoribonuclease and PAP phosphatase NrnA
MMNYQESQEILEEINKAKKILVNLHRGPDPDSFACAFALYYFLCSLGKDVTVVLTKTSDLSSQLSSMEESKLVKQVDYGKFDFSKYDLFITPDSGSWQQIVDNEVVKIPEIPIIVIDHHASNDKFGKINLVDSKAVSCAQIVYLLFKDWDYFIDTKMANLLMMGIVTDSGGFAFSNDPKILFVAGELIELGADKEKIINKFLRTKSYGVVKAFGELINRMELDEEHKFIWTAVSYDDYVKLRFPTKSASIFATEFASVVEGTNFGIVMYEDDPNKLNIGLRSRSAIDVSKLAEQLGGGGHKKAAGGQIKGLSFEKAVEKVLQTARKYAKEN